MIKLWNQTMPHRCVEDAFEPYLTPYDCDAAKTAIVVCPGGAYCGRADYEGNDVGAWLNTIGITAFVLEYRVAPSKAPAQPSDAQRAMRLARKLCMERGIERLGIMGFSAGGHLAATLSVHYDEAFYPPQDELDNPAANFCAQLLHQCACQQGFHAERSIIQQRLDSGIHLPVIFIDFRLQSQEQLQELRNTLIPVSLTAQIRFFTAFRVRFL